MLLNREESCLLLIDVQEKLAPLVKNSENLIARCQWLLRLAHDLSVPQIVSEQYPSGLGKTVAPLQNLIAADKVIEKLRFSCAHEKHFTESLQSINKKQMLLIGIETHVCVLQTALDLLSMGFAVFVVVDAVSSRHDVDHKYGLKRMKHAGAELVTAEMVFFEWVRSANMPEFKALSKNYF